MINNNNDINNQSQTKQQKESPSNSQTTTSKGVTFKHQNSIPSYNNNSQIKVNLLTQPSLNHQNSQVNNTEKSGWIEVEKTKDMLENVIEDLDKKLNRVLAKQEYEYLKGYNIYVKRKEKELRELIEKLNEKNSNNTFKDEKIYNLEKTIHAIREDQIKQEKEKDQLNEKVKYWKTKALGYEQEKDFLQQQIMDAKRQNKLLKLAIGRLQNELQSKEVDSQQKINNNVDQKAFFLTEQQEQLINNVDMSQVVDVTTAQTSLLEAGISKLSMEQRKKLGQRRVMTRSPTSRYRYIATENVKFQKFLDIIFKTKMQMNDIKEEISKYVQALETNYCDVIKELKQQIDREKVKTRKALAEKTNEFSEKNEMETLFVDCIEEIRKDIMKRRLKNEIYNKKKFQQIEKNTEEAREFEESLLKLAQLAKNRIKLEDFTLRDKCNLLDLFVNNEKTLLKIYEALFPHRATQNQQPNLMNMKTSYKDNQITLRNSQLQMNPYFSQNDTQIESKNDQKFPQIMSSKNAEQTMIEFGSIRQSQTVNNSYVQQ